MVCSRFRFSASITMLSVTWLAMVPPLLISPPAHAQVFVAEVLPPIAGIRHEAKIKDIADDGSLLVENLNSSSNVIDTLYLRYQAMTGYDPPVSLGTLGFRAGGLNRNGYYAVGSQQDDFGDDRAAFMTTNNGMITTVHPPEYEESFIQAGAHYYVGWVSNMGVQHAAFTPVSNPGELIDQHDFLANTLGAGLHQSQWYGTHGYNTVGWATYLNTPGNRAIALLDETPVDLHPPGMRRSEAFATYDRFQVGWGEEPSGLEHAIVWSGSAASAFSLNPAGFGNCRAADIEIPGIVGYGKINERDHALFWQQTTNEVQGFGAIDLHNYLPPEAINSVAVGINYNGIIAGHFRVRENKVEVWKPVLWYPINLQSVSVSPNPVMGGLGAMGTVTLSRPAPKGGLVVTLGPASSLYLNVPASVMVSEGQTTATFPVRTYGVVRTVKASVSATLVHQRRFHTVTIDPLRVTK